MPSSSSVVVPFHLLVMFFLPGLSFHLLHFDGVGLSAPHVQLVVAHAQRQDALVDAQARRVKHKVLQHRSLGGFPIYHGNHGKCIQKTTYGRFLVDGLDGKLLVVEGDVSDLAPGEAYLGRQPEENIVVMYISGDVLKILLMGCLKVNEISLLTIIKAVN